MARDLLASPPLAGQFEDVFGNQLVATIRLAPFRPLSPTHGRVCFKGWNRVLASGQYITMVV